MLEFENSPAALHKFLLPNGLYFWLNFRQILLEYKQNLFSMEIGRVAYSFRFYLCNARKK